MRKIFSDKRFLAFAVLVLALGVSLFTRFRLMDMAIERDEGEFGYIAQLILDGESPYVAYNYKLPGVSYVYAAFMGVFGENTTAIRLAVLAANLFAVAGIFFLGRRLRDTVDGALAAACYCVLTVAGGVLGNAAHATQFINAFAVFGFLLLLQGFESFRPGRMFWAGLLLGLALTMKQHAVVFAPFAGLMILYTGRGRGGRKVFAALVLFGAGYVLPYLLVAGVALAQGAFPVFWRWTFEYSGGAASSIPLSVGLRSLVEVYLPLVTHGFEMVWILGMLALFALPLLLMKRQKKIFLGLLLVFSMLGVLPGFYFRNHYFIIMLPALCLAAVALLRDALATLGGRAGSAAALAVLALLVSGVFRNAEYFFFQEPDRLVRELYGANPFLESIPLAEFILERTDPDDTVAVLGSEAQIYFYTRRRAATGYIYMYGLVDGGPYNETMQREMIREVESARPAIIIMTNVAASWALMSPGPHPIFTWAGEYLAGHYRRVGVIDIFPDHTTYAWDAEAARNPKSADNLLVFERIP